MNESKEYYDYLKWEFEKKREIFEQALMYLPTWSASKYIVELARILFGKY